MLITLSAFAQTTIDLSGKVTNRAGNSITNAIVTLVGQGLKDTTGTDGAYKLSQATSVKLPLLKPNSQSITLYKNFIDFSLPNPSPVQVEVFDVKGVLLKKELKQNTTTGFYRFNIEENFRTEKLLVIKASVGRDEVTFRYLPFHNGNSTVNRYNTSNTPVEEKGLSKITAISDTLRTTAANYTTNSTPISSYSQVVNITLDTAGGGAKPSPGCGKAATFQGEKMVTVTAGSAGSRYYYIRLPDSGSYDANHPYALWFTIHCMNGSAENVAHSETDTRARYEYLGMWRCANPTGQKGTTIFCAPQGIGNAWGQGANDLTFFRYMINKFENELCIDMSRIFASGFSMGGSMSYALACAMPDTMRAICMHSGGSMSGCDGSHRGPVPIFITHGTDDGTCTWPGSGVPQINDLATRDGCTTEDLASECHPTDIMHPVCVEYKNCKPGYPCRACIFKGPHIGSPGTQGSYGKNDTWAPDSAWSFFKRFY
jgi:poly(3-hydroxybutyrate) depolymerase